MKKFWIYFIKYRDYAYHVHNLFQLFTNYIWCAANDTLGLKTYSNESKLNVTKKEHLLKSDIRKLENKYKQTKKSKIFFSRKIIRSIKNKINKLYKKLSYERKTNTKIATETTEARINDSAIDNSKEFFRLHKNETKTTTTTKLGPLEDTQGNVIATTNEEIANELLNHFNKDLEPIRRQKYTQEHINFHNHVDDFINKYQINHNKNNHLINKPFTNHEMMRVLCSLNLNSAMSYDMIHYKILNICRYEIITEYTALSNLGYHYHQIFPECWTKTPITPIPKIGRPSTIAKNIRPISVAPALLAPRFSTCN